MQAVGCDAIIAARHDDGLVGGDRVCFGVDEQRFAGIRGGWQRFACGRRTACSENFDISAQLVKRVTGIYREAGCRGTGQMLHVAQGPDVGLINFQRPVVGIVSCFLALDFGFQVAAGIESAHREHAHDVVGLVEHRSFWLCGLRDRGTAQYPITDQGQQPHEQHRKVERQAVPEVA